MVAETLLRERSAPRGQLTCPPASTESLPTTERQGGSLLAAALSYAERGWSVLPLKARSKAPLGKLVPHGLKDATTNPDTIRAWWAECADANVGLVREHKEGP